MSSDSLDNPAKALGVAGAALQAASLVQSGSGAAALATGAAGLAGRASPQLAQALQVASQAHSLAQQDGALAGHARHAAAPVQQGAAAVEHLAIEEHPLAGQAVSDFAAAEGQYVPATIDPAGQDDAASNVAAALARFNDGKRLLRFYSPLTG